MMKELSVSVIVNTYNRAAVIGNLLASLNWQRYQNFEVIIVNGPSNDNTAQILNAYSDRVHIARCPEANLSMSRNIGISLAVGDIVAFIDDDAVPEPDWLEALCIPYADPAVGAVGGFIRDHTGYSYQCKVIACDRFGDSTAYQSVEEACAAGVAEHGPGSARYLSPTGCNSSFRRAAIEQIGGFDEEYAYFLEETDAIVRLIDAGWKVSYAASAEVHHKYAESHLRSADKVPRSMLLPARSKAYFAVRHGAGPFGISAVLDYLSRYRIDRRTDKAWLFDNNIIDFQHYQRLVEEINRGTSEGVADAFLFSSGRKASFEKKTRKFSAYPILLKSLERLRICFLSQDYPPGPVGGIALWTHTLALSLAALGHEVSVITRGTAHSRVDFEEGVWVHRIPQVQHRGRIDPSLPDLPDTITDWAYTAYDEVVRIRARRGLHLVSAPIWDVEGAACLADGTLPIITSLHSTYKLVLPSKRKWIDDKEYRRLHVDKLIEAESWMLQNSQAIMANSVAIVRDIEATYELALDQSRVHLVPHGLPEAQDTDLLKIIDGVRILYVGRFEARKGIDILTEAITYVLEQVHKATFVLVGDTDVNEDGKVGTYRKKLEELAARYPGQVEIKGTLTRDELMIEYTLADIFVGPSRYESFGLVFLEAMMHGVACVGSRVGGIPEVIEEGQTGLLVPPEDSLSLAKAIMRLLGDQKLRQQLGQAGREAYLTQFTAGRMAELAVAMYIEISQTGLVQIGKASEESPKKKQPTKLAWEPTLTVGDLSQCNGELNQLLRPIIQRREGAWTVESGWPHQSGGALRSSIQGDMLRIHFPEAINCTLLLLRHSWSGSAEVTVGNSHRSYKLFDEETSLLEIPLVGLSDAGGVIELRNTGSVIGSLDSQTWLIGYRCDGVLWPVELGQPVSRMIRLIEGDVGTFLAFRADTGIAEALSLHGVWGTDELSVFAKYLMPGMNVIDVGANIGHHSVALARFVTPGGRVLCIEPQQELNHLLQANLTINGITCASVVNFVVGSSAGISRLSPIDYEKAGNFGALDVASDEPSGESVTMTTLDALVADHFVDKRIHFIKIDTQSFELFVLQGAKDLLLRDSPLIYLEISPYWMKRRGYDYQEIYLFLEEHNYNWKNIRYDVPAVGAIPEWDGVADVEWNLLAIPHNHAQNFN